jgi:hypothetical protein
MKLQSLMIGCALFGIGLVGMTAAGCTATASGGGGTSSGGNTSSGGTASGGGAARTPPSQTDLPANTPCTVDASVTCSSPDELGVSCPPGTSPDDPTIVCSDPTPTGGMDTFCCVDFSTSADPNCTPDPTVTCPDPTSFGFSCTIGADTPDVGDPTLVCSDSSATATADVYCCTDGYSGGAVGCSADPSIACADTSSSGFHCEGGADPEATAGDVCSAGQPNPSGGDDYCCVTGFSGGTCLPDDVGCSYPDIGFRCQGADTPDQTDPTLAGCSVGTPDTNGDTLFCCQ